MSFVAGNIGTSNFAEAVECEGFAWIKDQLIIDDDGGNHLNITDIQADHFCIPLDTPLSDATHGEITHFGLVTVQMTCTNGEQGLGYTYTVGDIGTASIHQLIESDLAPILLGRDARDIDGLWQDMWWRLHFVGRGGLASFALAALDVALWDVNARARVVPLWRMLGGGEGRVPAYAGGIDLDFTHEQLQAQTNGFIEQGFRAIKMKVGREQLSEDVGRVNAMREWVGPDMPLMVDANMRWSVSEAIRAAHAFAEADLFWLEEPTIPDDVDGHAQIAREGGIPIASGENLHSVYEFRDLILKGGVSFPEPDAATLGGITPWLRVAHLAAIQNLPVTSHGVHDLHVHLLGGIGNASYLEVHGFGLERFIESPLRVVDGQAIAPDRPGHGVVFDFDALKSLAP